MAKLPTSLLARSLPSPTLLTSTARPTLSSPATTTRTHQPSQVRHATEVQRLKRPFTFTQIIQLSDGSTYTTRTTSPQPVFRSTRDSRNHLKWQPSDPALQNVEVDEAGKLAGFRHRFGTAFDMAPAAALAAKEMREDATRDRTSGRKRQGFGRKRDMKLAAAQSVVDSKKVVDAEEVKREAEAKVAAAARAAEEDSFTSFMTSYVKDQPSLKGGSVASKGGRGKKKK